MIRALLLALAASPAAADPALLDFMGGQGCTIGADSRAAAIAAGFDAAAIDALVTQTLADGRANQQGAYVVLNAATCTIRLPDIPSAYTVNSPEIRAITSPVDALAADGNPGCFVLDASFLFDSLNGGETGDGFHTFMDFVGAGLISGDLRFYSPDVMSTPITYQNVSGDCANVPDIDAIRRSHQALVGGFGDYVRLMGAEAVCGVDDWSPKATAHAFTVQGADPDADPASQPQVNAWLWFEYDLITMAAGWHEGMTGTDKGIPRPPLCHYPTQG